MLGLWGRNGDWRPCQPSLGPAFFGIIVIIGGAAETADTCAEPADGASAATAPCDKCSTTSGNFCLAGDQRHSQIHNITGCGAVSAHGVRQRFQGSVSGFSGPAGLI